MKVYKSGRPRQTKADQGIPRQTKAYHGRPKQTKANWVGLAIRLHLPMRVNRISRQVALDHFKKRLTYVGLSVPK